MDWQAKLAEARREHMTRLEAVSETGARPDLELAAVAGASWAAGLSLLMLGRRAEALDALRTAAEEYVVSWDAAPPGSWGRPIAAIRCRLMAQDAAGARADAERTLAEGAAVSDGPFARYAATLADLALGRDDEAAALAQELARADDFLTPVAEALLAIARADDAAYGQAARAVLSSFEERDAFLEDVVVADTVIVLAEFAAERGLSVSLQSPLLPPNVRDTPDRDM